MLWAPSQLKSSMCESMSFIILPNRARNKSSGVSGSRAAATRRTLRLQPIGLVLVCALGSIRPELWGGSIWLCPRMWLGESAWGQTEANDHVTAKSVLHPTPEEFAHSDCPETDTPQSPKYAIQQKMREVLIGFDSAWTDSPKNPGAISAYVLEGRQYETFHPPRQREMTAHPRSSTSTCALPR
jgi:hypothetical protein